MLLLWGIKATRSSPMSDWSQEGRRTGKKRSFPCDIFFEVTTKGWSEGLRGIPAAPYTFISLFISGIKSGWEWDITFFFFFFFSTDCHPAHFLPSLPLSAKLNCYFFFSSWQETLNRVITASQDVINHGESKQRVGHLSFCATEKGSHAWRLHE